MDQLANDTLNQELDPLASTYYTDLKTLVNFYIKQFVQTQWGEAVHDRDLYINQYGDHRKNTST